ncbi:MAG: cell division protein FtsQ/DivIB [Spirochaetota bacterium]
MFNKNNKIIKFYIVIGIAVLILIASLVVFNSNYIFSLKKVYVSGNDNISFDSILSMSGLEYAKPLTWINSEKIRKRLLINPFIKQVNVKVLYPDAIKILIKERKPFASLKLNNVYYIIDKEAIVLRKKDKLYEKNELLRIKISGIDYDKYDCNQKIHIPELNEMINSITYTNEIYPIINDIHYINLIVLPVNKAEVYLKFNKINTTFHFMYGHMDSGSLVKAYKIYKNLVNNDNDKVESVIMNNVIIGKY